MCLANANASGGRMRRGTCTDHFASAPLHTIQLLPYPTIQRQSKHRWIAGVSASRSDPTKSHAYISHGAGQVAIRLVLNVSKRDTAVHQTNPPNSASLIYVSP